MVVSSTSIKVGITTTAATSHGFAAAEALEGESAAAVICHDQPSSGIDHRLMRKACRLAETSRHRGRSAVCSSKHKEQPLRGRLRYRCQSRYRKGKGPERD